MAGSPAWSGMAATRPAFVDTAGGSSEQPCRGGEATRTMLRMPITQLPGRPLQPTGEAAAAWGQGAGKAPARHRETFPVALPTGQILSGLGGAPLLFCAGLECGNQSPAPWCGRWGYIPQMWRGRGRHPTCQAGLPGVRRGPAHHTPRLQTPCCLHPSPSLKLENSLQS